MAITIGAMVLLCVLFGYEACRDIWRQYHPPKEPRYVMYDEVATFTLDDFERVQRMRNWQVMPAPPYDWEQQGD